MKEFGKKYPLVFGALGFVMVLIMHKLVTFDNNWLDGLKRIVMSVLLILIMWPAVGNRWLKFPGGGWKSSFKLYKVPLIALIVFAVLMVGANLIGSAIVSMDPAGETARMLAEKNVGFLNPNLLTDALSVIFMMTTVGIFEELAFRRALFDLGMLQFPKMKNRAMWMAVISSFIFGFVHVMSNLSLDWLAVITAILKIMASGIMGFIMCAAVIEGQNIWPIAVIHALGDILPALPGAISTQKSMGTNYVVASTSGTPLVMALLPNLLIAAFSIPAFIKSIKILKKYDEEHTGTPVQI